MKIQCACGAKYEFDTTPEMADDPVKFVCPQCGLDSSDRVNDLIREEFGIPPLPPIAAPRLKIARDENQPAPAPAGSVATSKFCTKHPRVPVTGKCAVCQKPICPECMAMFGYFCSPLCKGKAEAQKIDVPIYAGRKDLIAARSGRKTGLILGALGAVVVLALGVWAWYVFVGSVPHPYFSVRFDDASRAYSGTSQLVGKNDFVFLHGSTLARCDLKTKKQIWSQELVTTQQIADVARAETDLEARQDQENTDGYHHRRSADDIERTAKQLLQAELTLRVAGQNIWVKSTDKLTHFSWDSGEVLREIPLPERGELVQEGDELLVLGAQTVTHVSLASGDFHTEELGATSSTATASAENNSTGIGLSGAASNQPLNPQKVESQVQGLNLPGRIALPALLANAEHERQLEAALRDNPQAPRPETPKMPAAEIFRLVPGAGGGVQFSARLLEAHMVTRSAMSAASGSSALNGDLNGAKSAEAANETLNEMQRNSGGGSVTEDESRYQVSVHLPGATGAADWTGEVIGPPQLFVLKTVNVVTAGKTVIVLDKSNKKIWQAELTYNVPAGGGESRFGAGPCVERDGSLYVFDQAVLSAFDLTTGTARWRLPSVGVVGLFFDDHGDVYVNTTTGNPDDIKYSRQIDISRKTEAVLLKIDSKTGKTLWSIKPDGYISNLSGKFIYTVASFDPNPGDQDVLNDMTDIQKPPYLRIARLRPSDGRVLWEAHQDRCPVDVRFDENSIELIFKREVQVLRFLAF
jgi:hypothetical protein